MKQLKMLFTWMMVLFCSVTFSQIKKHPLPPSVPETKKEKPAVKAQPVIETANAVDVVPPPPPPEPPAAPPPPPLPPGKIKR